MTRARKRGTRLHRVAVNRVVRCHLRSVLRVQPTFGVRYGKHPQAQVTCPARDMCTHARVGFGIGPHKENVPKRPSQIVTLVRRTPCSKGIQLLDLPRRASGTLGR